MNRNIEAVLDVLSKQYARSWFLAAVMPNEMKVQAGLEEYKIRAKAIGVEEVYALKTLNDEIAKGRATMDAIEISIRRLVEEIYNG